MQNPFGMQMRCTLRMFSLLNLQKEEKRFEISQHSSNKDEFIIKEEWNSRFYNANEICLVENARAAPEKASKNYFTSPAIWDLYENLILREFIHVAAVCDLDMIFIIFYDSSFVLFPIKFFEYFFFFFTSAWIYLISHEP